MKQYLIPGEEFLIREEGGLTLARMATKCHEEGYLTDDEFADAGGVPALRRKLYAITVQHMDFPRPGSPPRDARSAARARLTREANAAADEFGFNDPKYIRGDIRMEDLEAFDIPVTGENLIEAELLASLMRRLPARPPLPNRKPQTANR